MIIRAVKTRVLHPPQDDLLSAIKRAIRTISEQSILVATSKVVSIWQGRCVPKEEVAEKDKLIIEEAEQYIPRNAPKGVPRLFTLKNNLLFSASGVDESNANDYYILWPEHPEKAAKELWRWARKTYKVRKLGVIITDSHPIPMRRGTIGISLGFYGFVPIRDYRDTKDIFGRKFKFSQHNIPDSLAAAAVFTMGEGKEQTPVALIRDIPGVVFTDKSFRPRKKYSSFQVELEEDVYAPFFLSARWRKGGKYKKRKKKR